MSAKNLARALALSAVLIPIGSAASAQMAEDDAQKSSLEEIVVTARRSSESMLRVPVTVSAITATAMQNHAVTDLFKLSEMVPQIVIGQASSGTGALLSIRGIGSSPLDSGVEQSVSVIVDGVQMSRGRIITQGLFDMQQAEVLQGPQALFFGKNSPAGVISLKSANPTDILTGYLRGGYEFEAKERYAEGAISGPLTENLKARVAFRASKMDGWIDRISPPLAVNPFFPGAALPGSSGKQPASKDYAGRLTLQWTPSSDFEALFKLLHNRQRLNGGGSYSQTFCAPGVANFTVVGVVDPNGNCDKNRRATAGSALPPELAVNLPYGNGGKPYLRATNTVGSLNLSKDLGDVKLVSTTGYYRYFVPNSNAADGSSYTVIYNAEAERYRLWTQELRANSSFDGPINFAVGAYFDTSKRFHYGGPVVFASGINPATGNYAAFQREARNSGKTYSVFGQLRWEIVPDVELAGGARWTHETKRVNIGNIAVNPANPLGVAPVGYFVRGRYKDSNVSPEATLTWHPTRTQTIYGAYKTGYKSGGFSNVATLPPGSTPASLLFKSEKAKGGEIGYKAELLDRTMRVNMTVYDYKYSNLQVSAFNPTTISFSIANAATAVTKGFEGSMEWKATPEFTFTGALSYNDGKFKDFPNAQCYPSQTAATGCVGGFQDFSGKRLIRAPRWSFNFGGTYEVDLNPNWQAALSADTSYSGAYHTSDQEDPGTVQSSFWRVNAALHLRPADRRFDVAIIGRNLTNKYYLVFAQGRPTGGTQDYIGFFNRPREIALQVEVKF